MKRRIGFVAGFGIVWVLLIAARLYDLQVVRYDHYSNKAERQQQRVVALDPPRGTIYDAQGRELAVSIQVDSVYAVPPEIEEPAAAAAAIARAVPGLDGVKLARQLTGDREFVWVARKLDPPVAARVHALKLKGLYFVPESKRYYPMGDLAAQVLGYVGTDNHGLAGLELVYDREITGKPGKRTVLRDARQGTVAAPDLSSAEPQPGQDLYLTLDATVQHIAERELARAIEERHAKRGSALFLDPRTGGVLAMASYPTFDPNDFASYPPDSWRNRAIADVYEPGSTFKMVTAAAALEAGVVRATDRIDCGMGSITLFRDIRVHDHERYGMLTFAQVIAHSSNIGVIRVAQRMSGERFYGTIRGLGFGGQLGIDLPGESAGILHPVERWGLLEKDYIAFGQGVSVTPLQLVAAAGAVANGGTLLRPHMVDAVSRGERGEVRLAKFTSPPVLGHPITPATAAEVTRLLEGVVIEGTGKSAAIPGYQVAGKTGTAQIPVRGGYRGYLPSFVGFAPSDRPAVVGLVAIAEPQGNEYYGAQVAAPAFSAIIRQVLLYRGVHPRRDRPTLWAGQVPQGSRPMLAKLTPATAQAHPLTADESLADGDEHDTPVMEVPEAPKAPTATPVALKGGRPHAPR